MSSDGSAAAERQRLRDERASLKRQQEKEAERERNLAEEKRRDDDAAEERRKMLQAAKEKKKILDAARKRKEEELGAQNTQSSNESDDLESGAVQTLTPTLKVSMTPKALTTASPSQSVKTPASTPKAETDNALVIEDNEVRGFDSPDLPTVYESNKKSSAQDEIVVPKPSITIKATVAAEYGSDEDDSMDEEFYNSPVRVVKS